MGGKVLNGCRINIGFPIPAWRSKSGDWNDKSKIEKWVKDAGGVLHKEIDDHTTTHLVVDQEQWMNRTRAVQVALEANENGRKVHIVSPDWLESCLMERKKCRETTYLWEKLDQAASKEKQKKRGKPSTEAGVEDEGEDGEIVRRAPQAMLGEVFQHSTEPYLEERDRRALEAEEAGELKAKKEREEAEAIIKELEKKAELQKRKERTELMRKTVKKGRGEVFNEQYHSYQDGSGFKYDIMLTKVDTLTNSNERINLTIFESNAKPRTYATNLHFAGTGKRPLNNIIAAIGANLTTATRMFRKAFLEKTGVNWDDRIKAHNERVRARGRDGETPGLYSTRRGEDGEIMSKTRADENLVPFDKRAFECMPPLHAARGWLPDGKEQVPEVVRQMRAAPNGRNDRTEEWMMSGGNGSGPDDGDLPMRESIEQSQFPAQIDLTEDEPAGQLDLPMTTDGFGFFGGNTTNGGDAEVGHGIPGGAGAEDFNFNTFFADAQNWSGQEPTFDAGGLSGQQQPQFDFGQDGPDSNVEQPNAQLLGNEGDGFGTDQLSGHSIPEYNNGGEDIFGGNFDAKMNTDAGSPNHPDFQARDAGVETAGTSDNDNEQGALGSVASDTVTAGSSVLPFETQVGQTQLATTVGEDLLGLEDELGAAAAGTSSEVPVESIANEMAKTPEAALLEGSPVTGANKRKRDDSENDFEGQGEVAKKVATGYSE